MTDLQDRPAELVPRPRRGGNRLAPGRYPDRGPSYERSKTFGPDRERRDRHQRERVRRAVTVAKDRGELHPTLTLVMYVLLNVCNDRLLEPGPDASPQCSGWWSLRFIHDLVYTSPDAGDDLPGGRDAYDTTGSRTAGRWMHALAELGWVEKIHRHRLVNGEQWGTSNLWRLRIPDPLRAELHAAEDASRTRAAGRRPKHARPPVSAAHSRDSDRRAGRPGRDFQVGTQAAAAAQMAQNDAIRAHPCPACEGVKFVPAPPPMTGSLPCGACGGYGSLRHGP